MNVPQEFISSSTGRKRLTIKRGARGAKRISNMRLTADEILEMYPSMNMNGKNYNLVVGQYYGDLPVHTDSTEYRFVQGNYPLTMVSYYRTWYGEGYLKGDIVESLDVLLVGGSINVKYKNRIYHLHCFNNHLGINGLTVWSGDTGKVTILGRQVPEDNGISLPTKAVGDTISDEMLCKLLQIVEDSDEYGMFGKKFVKCAKQIMEEY